MQSKFGANNVVKVEKLNDRTVGACTDLTTKFMAIKQRLREQQYYESEDYDPQRERFKPKSQLLQKSG